MICFLRLDSCRDGELAHHAGRDQDQDKQDQERDEAIAVVLDRSGLIEDLHCVGAVSQGQRHPVVAGCQQVEVLLIRLSLRKGFYRLNMRAFCRQHRLEDIVLDGGRARWRGQRPGVGPPIVPIDGMQQGVHGLRDAGLIPSRLTVGIALQIILDPVQYVKNITIRFGKQFKHPFELNESPLPSSFVPNNKCSL